MPRKDIPEIRWSPYTDPRTGTHHMVPTIEGKAMPNHLFLNCNCNPIGNNTNGQYTVIHNVIH